MVFAIASSMTVVLEAGVIIGMQWACLVELSAGECLVALLMNIKD